ncbi:hypothetical protein [Helicobacter sp. T3_23-1056]
MRGNLDSRHTKPLGEVSKMLSQKRDISLTLNMTMCFCRLCFLDCYDFVIFAKSSRFLQ